MYHIIPDIPEELVILCHTYMISYDNTSIYCFQRQNMQWGRIWSLYRSLAWSHWQVRLPSCRTAKDMPRLHWAVCSITWFLMVMEIITTYSWLAWKNHHESMTTVGPKKIIHYPSRVTWSLAFKLSMKPRNVYTWLVYSELKVWWKPCLSMSTTGWESRGFCRNKGLKQMR